MRFAKIVGVLLVAISAQVSYAQTQPDNSLNHDRERPESIHIFPNPATEYVHVKVESIPASQVKLDVHNIIGNEMPIEFEVMDEQTLRVRVKEFATGYYLLAVKHEKSNYKQIIKFLKR
jgi:hypothetical protein